MIGLYRPRTDVVRTGVAAPNTMKRGRIASVAAGLVVLTAAALGGVAHNDFISFDDHVYLTENPALAGGLTARGLAWAFTTTRTGNWHPLTWVSHVLDVQLFGMRPEYHHLMNLGLHIVATLLLFSLLRGLTGALWRPALVAALFAVHPLHVESVAWASERKDVLSLLLTFLTALAYLAWVRRRGAGRYATTVILFALALMAKPTPVTLPFLLLLLDWWPLGRWTPGARLLPPAPLWLEKLPLLLLASASAVVTFLAQAGEGTVVRAEALQFPVRAANAAVSYVRYLGKTLIPADLSVFYPHPSFVPPWWQWSGSLLLLAAITWLAARSSRRHPWLAVGWFWFLGTLVPMIGLVQVGAQAMADRYTYLPLTGIFLLVAWEADRASRGTRLRPLVAAAATVAVLAAALVTSAQVALWRDSVTLFRHALALAPRPRADAPPDPARAPLHNILGISLAEAGKPDEAIEQYREALAVNPHYADAMNNLGRALDDKGLTDEAIPFFELSMSNDPRSAEPRSNLGGALLSRGAFADAARFLREAIALDPEHVAAHNNLAVALASLGRTTEAEEVFLQALALDPASALAHLNYGKFLHTQGRTEESLRHVREGFRLNPALVPGR